MELTICKKRLIVLINVIKSGIIPTVISVSVGGQQMLEGQLSLEAGFEVQFAMASALAETLKGAGYMGTACLNDMARPAYWAMRTGVDGEEALQVRQTMDRFWSMVALILADMDVDKAERLIGIQSGTVHLNSDEFIERVKSLFDSQKARRL